MSVHLKDHKIFKELLSLPVKREDFAIFGSACLFIRGLINKISDVDIIARGEAWEMFKLYGKPNYGKYSHDVESVLSDGDIEVFNAWHPGVWNVDDLIDTADIHEGLRFVKISNVLKFKKILNRPKDIPHIEAIKHCIKVYNGLCPID